MKSIMVLAFFALVAVVSAQYYGGYGHGAPLAGHGGLGYGRGLGYAGHGLGAYGGYGRGLGAYGGHGGYGLGYGRGLGYAGHGVGSYAGLGHGYGHGARAFYEKVKDKRILFYKFNDQDYELDQNRMIKVFPVDSGSEYLQ
ncbi:hypothetical protein BLOT_014612 [Blomia tropicalis]|nr:hypothetical protein BLOT_014612 [Blomia tropicalis]